MATRTAQANVFSTETVLTSTGGIAYNFGFVATYVRVTNMSGSPLRINLASTSSSTDGELVPALATREWRDVQVATAGLTTTSTTTSTGALATTRKAQVFASA